MSRVFPLVRRSLQFGAACIIPAASTHSSSSLAEEKSQSLHPRAHAAQLASRVSAAQLQGRDIDPNAYLGVTKLASLPASQEAVLLISDIDGTLTGDDEALKAFKEHWLGKQQQRGSVLCYNTARSLKYYIIGLQSKELPALLRPDVLIVGEGTEIWFLDQQGKPQLCCEWDQHIREHWDLPRVAAAMHHYHDGSIDGLNDGEDFRFSITCAPGDRESAAATIRAALGAHYDVIAMDSWLPNVSMVTALPRAAGKGKAAMYLRDLLKFDRSRTMWAGDTKGDASFLDTDIQGVVVRNASLEFLTLAAQRPGVAKLSQGWSAFGVLQGLQDYGLA